MVPRLLSIATGVPPHLIRQEEVLPAAIRHFTAPARNFERLLPVFRNAEIETRCSCVPLDWYSEPHSFSERNELYLENAVDLLGQVALASAEAAGVPIEDFGAIVTVSSTGIVTPGLDTRLMERLAFRRDVVRLPIFGLGCAGGVMGLARAGAMARSEPDRPVLLLVVELCGLTFRANDFSKSNVVATALFGDGVAAAVTACNRDGAAIRESGEHTWRDSLRIMGWNVRDDGLGVVFSRDIPSIVPTQMRAAAEAFLRHRGIEFADFDEFVCHPGGIKVIEALEQILALQPGGFTGAREVLRGYGNMSAPTVFFVLERALQTGGDAKRLLTALGPGFSAAFLVLDGLARTPSQT